MTRKFLQFLMGINGASAIRGLRLGVNEFGKGSYASFGAAHPFETPDSLNQKKIRADLDLIPLMTIGELLDTKLHEKKEMVRLDLSRHQDGQLPLHDALALLAILVAEHPAEVLEIGTFMGHTTKAMAQNLPDAIIHTMDLPPDFSEQENVDKTMPKDDFHLIQRRVVGREFKGHAVESRIRQHFGDTAKIKFKEFGKSDFFFIDGSHTYEYCRQDSEKCFALCGGAGTFLWHDCDEWHPGVIKFVNEWRAIGRDICRIEGTTLAYWKSVNERNHTTG